MSDGKQPKKSKVYVEITPPPTPKNSDVKVPGPVVNLHPALQNRGKGGRLKPITVKLVGAVSSTASASGAQTPVDSLNANGATEFTSFAALYDEFKVNAVDVLISVSCNAASSAIIECGVAFDPVNSGAYTTPNNVLVASQHRYWVLGGESVTVLCQTKDGLIHFRAKIPRGPTVQISGTTPVGNEWCPCTASSSNTVCGYAKFAIDASSAGNTTLLRTYVYHVTFRSRS